MATAAFVASANCLRRELPASAWANNTPQIVGFTSDSIVTTAWSCCST